MSQHEKINYVEFPCRDLEQTKKFFTEALNWQFVDYGPDYTAFSGEGLDGGFYKSEHASASQSGAALIVFYSETLEQTQQKLVEAGANIVQETFSFPGGRRFHFCEPSGNEFAVWSDK